MPELKNEFPSHEELTEYLDIHFNESMLSPLRQTDAELAGQHESLMGVYRWMRRADGGEFARLAYGKLFDGLARLNQLPRTDPFWHNTNNRPTYFKLPEYSRRLLKENPKDPGALWIQAIIPCWGALNHFGQDAWLELHRLGGLDARWPIYAALVTSLFAGGVAKQLADYIREAGSQEASMPVLIEIALHAEGSAPKLAGRVIDMLRSPG